VKGTGRREGNFREGLGGEGRRGRGKLEFAVRGGD
jgi:hypothetical protein